MIELQNVTVYKCQYCNFTGTYAHLVQKHEDECLKKQEKSGKNLDKQKIYDCFNIKNINSLISEFYKKYNLSINENIQFASIIIDNNSNPYFELDNSCRSIFDWTKFALAKELQYLRSSEEYLSNLPEELEYRLQENIDVYYKLLIQKEELEKQGKELLLEAVEIYLERKDLE